MNFRFLLFALSLSAASAGKFATAEELIAAATPYAVEIAPIAADGLEIPKQRLELTDQGGWLVVTLTAEPGELEWRIVLAKIVPGVMPRVAVDPKLPFFTIQYGQWFIRESLGRLRVYREPKDVNGHSWNQIGNAPEGDTPCTAGRLFVVKSGDWYWVCTSPRYDRSNIDTLIRFQHQELKKGHGSMVFADGKFSEVFCGDARCHDEGDLLIAERITGYGARAMIANDEIKRSIVGNRMPMIAGTPVGALPLPDLAQLTGKVILVDFWATWCGPCVEKLPEINAIRSRFEHRGLVVIGVHSSQNPEDLPAFLADHEFTFPVVLSDGETEKLFAVSQFPSYFLVGRDGRVVDAGLSDPRPTPKSKPS